MTRLSCQELSLQHHGQSRRFNQFKGFLTKQLNITSSQKYCFTSVNQTGPTLQMLFHLNSPLKYECHVGLHDVNSSLHQQGRKQKMNSLQSPGITQLMLTSISPRRLERSPTSRTSRTTGSRRSPSRTPRRTNGDARSRPAPNHGAPEQRSHTNNWWLWKTSSARLGTCPYAKD